ncbi:Metallophosphoesterase domain-containing protein 1 [Grifola frondosa]|uniref:Metallophosphoesterase domain-containing protein 1 n=1 Tax=Grifola frondosa TaxID=5627 RepID=A0A1C7LMD4_GRIFR|nr:Metallophosphoesterase domain-containing protein 1 [Grifola frondosa]
MEPDRACVEPTFSSPSAAVYVTYDMKNPPPHPGEGWTRFVCISDTHSKIYPVPPGDVLLHSGDLSSHGTLKQLQVTTDWLKTLPHGIKIIIAGNHDICLDEAFKRGGPLHSVLGNTIRSKDISSARDFMRSQSLRKKGIYYLEHETLMVPVKSGRKWLVYGSPAAPRYSLGAFQYNREEGDALYAQIPSSIDILLTHGPPNRICDLTKHGSNAGCEALTRRLEHEDLSQCRLHVFGHIHEAHGAAVVAKSKKNPDGRVSVNAALRHHGQAVIVDLKD